MGPAKKLRFWRSKRRDRQQPSPASQSIAAAPAAASSAAANVSPSPASAQASASSTAQAPVGRSAATQVPEQSQPPQMPPALASDLFPFMRVVELPDASENATTPRLVYVSVSSDLRLIYAHSQPCKPSSLVDFRGADLCISLVRLVYEPPKSSAPPLPLDAIVVPRVRPETHSTGPAVRIADEKRSVLLIAASEAERDALLSALRLRVAPWPILRERMEAEMRAASAPSASSPSLADAARELFSGAAGASGGSVGSTSDAGGRGAAGVAKVVWEKAGTVAQTSLWAATFGQGFGGVVRTADELEKLSKPLGGLTVVGCAFSLVALSARAVSLMGMEREGRDRMAQAREDLRHASFSLVSWLFSILGSGFGDEDGLVGKVFDVLGECWGGADELEQYLLRNWVARAWKAEDIGVIVGKVEAVTGKLLAAGLLNVVAKHERRIGDLEEKAFVAQADVFRPYAPETFDFSVGLVGNAATSLARLKTAVLRTGSAEGSTGGLPCAAGSFASSSLRRVALTSVNGEGGVGKTSTCKLLCVDEDVRAYFLQGAILFMEVGQGASEEKVMSEVRKAVSKCGGKRAVEEIRSCGDVFEAVDIAREFFSERRVFIVADNVWETPVKSKVVSWAVTLSKIASFPGSAVIMTTRFALLSESSGFDRVHLGRLDLVTECSPDWRIAEELYDDLLGATPEERLAGMYVINRKKALNLTCGLPLGIKTFAGVVRSRLRFGDDVRSVLAKIEKRAIGLAGKFIGEDMSAATGHPGLFAAMEESLAFLDEHKGCRVNSAPLAVRKDEEGKNRRVFSASYRGISDRPLSSRYAVLEVMSVSSASISLQVLCRLWHLHSVEEAEEIALIFVNVGLGRLEKGSLGQDRVLCLHDLQYEFCTGMRGTSLDATDYSGASSPSSLNGHALLLSSCESLLNPEKDGDEIGIGWTSFCFLAAGVHEQILRQYLSQNLLRHMCAVVPVMAADGVRQTIRNMLSDFRWLRGRIAEDGRVSVLSDCATALAARSSASVNCSDEALAGSVHLFTGSTEKSIRELQQSLMLVDEGVSLVSDGTLAGSLIQLCQTTVVSRDVGLDAVFFRNLACSSERNVSGPWFKPIRGCSRVREQGVLARAVVGSGVRVMSLVALGDGAHFVSGSADGVVRVHESGYLGSVLELKGHADWVNCVDLAKKEGKGESFLLFSGSQDGAVRSWEVGRDPAQGVIEKARSVVGECGSRVWCVSVSESGDVVAAGCEDGTVFIWNRREGNSELSFSLVTNFSCAIAGKESRWVRGVAVSRPGDLVVAGERKGGIAFWSSGGSGSEGTVKRSCASEEGGADLRYVLLSEDDSSVSFVFGKSVGCEVWDIGSRRRRSPRVELPDFRYLTCAALSAGEEVCGEWSGAGGVLVTGGCGESWGNYFISVYSSSDDCKILSTFPLVSAPRSVCYASFSGDKRILVGSDDGCVHMLDACVSVASDGTEPNRGRAFSLGSGSSEASDAPGLEKVLNIAVMCAAGLVVAGHKDGRFSLWRAESGEFIRIFGDERGGWVLGVDISADESLAVSGHGNGVALVWNASTWECRFALEGRSRQVVCTTISPDAKRIVTVNLDGELRVWDAEVGGAALRAIGMGLKFSHFGSRGVISLDGGHFLWASRDRNDRKWRGKVFDLRSGSVIWKSEEARHLDWDAFSKEIMWSEVFDGEEVVPGRSGAVCDNRSVEVRDADSGQQSANGWRVSSGTERGGVFPRIDCALLSSEGGTIHTAASLSFDQNVFSIAAGWIPSDADGLRRAVVACRLLGRACPAIMHFYPTKN